jgi:integrase
MMTLAEEWGCRPRGSNPCTGTKRFTENQRQRFLGGDELARLGQAFAGAERDGTETPAALAALRLLLFTGCRLAEVRTLRWSYIDVERAMINLPDSKTGPKTVYLSAPALQVLAGLARPEGAGAETFVFPGRRRLGQSTPGDTAADTGRVTAGMRPVEDLRGPWQRVRNAAGMPELRMHDLRHTFASMGAAGGLSLQLIGGLLGHTTVRTTERYAHLVNVAQREAAERIGDGLARAIGAPPTRPA